MKTNLVNIKSILDVLVVDADSVSSAAIGAAFKNANGVKSVAIVNNTNEAFELITDGNVNALIVDIFSLGVKSRTLIQNTRKHHPNIPICLIGSRKHLSELPNISKTWRSRFTHYYKLAKDQPPEFLQKDAEVMANKLLTYWLARSANVKLSSLRQTLSKMEVKSPTFSPAAKLEIDETIDFVQKAIDVRKTESERFVGIVPGFEAQDIQILVKQTLNKASIALDNSARINTGILVFGGLLIAVSFIFTSVTHQWEAVAFGGVGLASVITSLITNPLKSIGVTSRRMVQIQIAYLSFLNQVSIISECPNDSSDVAMTRSKRLQEATQNIQETLEKYFG